MIKALALTLISNSLFLLPTSVIAQSADNKADSEVQKSEDENARICKTFKITGSRAKRERICMTKSQWAASEAAAKEEARRATSGVCGNGKLCSGTT